MNKETQEQSQVQAKGRGDVWKGRLDGHGIIVPVLEEQRRRGRGEHQYLGHLRTPARSLLCGERPGNGYMPSGHAGAMTRLIYHDIPLRHQPGRTKALPRA